MGTTTNWWKDTVIYEIFPKAFSEEGLKGVEKKLEDIKALGAETVWLCPVFLSPFLDSGYDISDYYSINPMFGDLDDFKSLLGKAHSLGMKIILDIALNHTSSTHHWFQQALRDSNSRYRNYYIFREGQLNNPPNSWISSKTRKSPWTYNQFTNDYYLHIYTAYQPDLNWANEWVREEAANILKYWLSLGVDGFRLDVINKIAKPDDLTVESDEEYSDVLYENHPTSHIYIHELRERVKQVYPNCFLLGQISGVTKVKAIEYSEEGRHELDSFLQFEHMDIHQSKDAFQREWHLSIFKDIIKTWQNFEGYDVTCTNFLSNHDSARIVSRLTNARGGNVSVAAKMLCLFQMCLKGIPIIYMGDELGVVNVEFSNIDEFSDIRSHDIYENLKDKGMDEDQIIRHLNAVSRDNARQKLSNNKKTEIQKFYKKVLEFRKISETLKSGETRLIQTGEDIFAYKRIFEKEIITVICNFTDKKIKYDYSDLEPIFTNYEDLQCGYLQPFEGRVYLGDIHEK